MSVSDGHLKRRAVMPILVVAGALLLLLGAVAYLAVDQAATRGEVTHLQIFNRLNSPCVLHERVRCERLTRAFIAALTPAERRELAGVIAPYLSGRHGHLIVVNRTIVRRVFTPGGLGQHGANGSNGANGQPGARGPAGPRGARGQRGAQGARGPAGPIGPIGPQGLPGKVIRIVCHVLHC